MQLPFTFLVLAVTIVAQPLVDGDVLEPSVRNEVEHALARAPACAPTNDVCALSFSTNGMSRSDVAIRLVSAQHADGRWYSGTNDTTAAVVEILGAL